MKKKKIGFYPTVEERRHAIQNVFYEIEQLIATSSSSTKNRSIVDKHALLDSVLMHARNLLDFYGRKKRIIRNGVEQDDVLVLDYGFPHQTIDVPLDVRKRLNKDLAHLMYDRSKRQTLEEKWWSYPPIVVPILEQSKEFVEHLQSNCLYLVAPEHVTAFVNDCDGILEKINGYLKQHQK